MRKNMPSNTNEKITKTISDMINIKANSIKNPELLQNVKEFN